jgi:hypothetical protein
MPEKIPAGIAGNRQFGKSGKLNSYGSKIFIFVNYSLCVSTDVAGDCFDCRCGNFDETVFNRNQSFRFNLHLNIIALIYSLSIKGYKILQLKLKIWHPVLKI